MNSNDLNSIEVELKFRVEEPAAMLEQLVNLGAIEGPIERHQDTYFRHPCRDFAQTREALRIRRVNLTTDPAGQGAAKGEARITYKGPHLVGPVKARRELEWQLDPSDPQGDQLQQLFELLGFGPVATVTKLRRTMNLSYGDRQLTVAIDDVELVGRYVEVEVLAKGEDDVPVARKAVTNLAMTLGLVTPEPRSYLSLLLIASGQ